MTALLAPATASGTTARRWAFGLLPLQFIVERSFLNAQLILKALRVDEWIRTAWRNLCVLLSHVVHRGVRAEWHIDMLSVQDLETLAVLRDFCRITREVGPAVDAHAA